VSKNYKDFADSWSDFIKEGSFDEEHQRILQEGREQWFARAKSIINNTRRGKHAAAGTKAGAKGEIAAAATIVAIGLVDEAEALAKSAALKATGASEVALTRQTVRQAGSRVGQVLSRGAPRTFMQGLSQQIGQAGAREVAKQAGMQLLKFAGKYALPWAFIGYEVSKIMKIWNENATGCMEYEIPGDTTSKCLKRGGNIQIWDWKNMKPAWTQSAVSRGHPLGPGTEAKGDMIQAPGYKGTFGARDYKEWPFEVQLAFCKKYGRKPMHMDLRSGGATGDMVYATGPDCEELMQQAKNRELDPEYMSLDPEDLISVDPENEGPVTENRKISLRVERKLIEEYSFQDHVAGMAVQGGQRVGNPMMAKKKAKTKGAAEQLLKKLPKAVTHPITKSLINQTKNWIQNQQISLKQAAKLVDAAIMSAKSDNPDAAMMALKSKGWFEKTFGVKSDITLGVFNTFKKAKTRGEVGRDDAVKGGLGGGRVSGKSIDGGKFAGLKFGVSFEESKK
jgi:hypothetical protein